MNRILTGSLLVIISWTMLGFGFQSKSVQQEPVEKKYRILSISTTENIILLSDLDSRNRLMLDAAKAKIIIDGKESDLKNLQKFNSATFQIKRSPKTFRGHELDGQVVRAEIDTRR
jgi:hypothetical protein